MSTPSKPWADTPYPLIPTPSNPTSHSSFYIATSMTLTHNCMLRGLNTIYHSAPHVAGQTDIHDLLFFTECWCNWVSHHHMLEEEIMFPGWEKLIGKEGFMGREVEQHHAFEAGLKKLKRYAEERLGAGKEGGGEGSIKYDGEALRGIIRDFADPFRVHLVDEIDTLLQLGQFEKESDAIMSKYKKAEKEAGKQVPEETFPLVLGLCDKTFEGGRHKNWPPMPWLAPYFVHYWFGRKHKGAWRFCPSDCWGNPRELAFSGRLALGGGGSERA
jgi:hemerythrin-like domain-containing protein